MANDVMLMGDVPTDLAVYSGQSNVNKDLGSGISGSPLNRISIDGRVFRIIEAGQETHVSDQPEMTAVIVGAQKEHSRIFYLKGYNPKAEKVRPDCFSHDGIKPSDQSPNKQANVCSTCPKNQKGSATNGDGKACAYKKRIVLATPEELMSKDIAEPRAFIFDVNGMSMFGEGLPNQHLFSLGGYANFLGIPRQGWPHGLPSELLVTRIVMQKESVPCVHFGPGRSDSGGMAFLPKFAIDRAIEFGKSEAVQRILAMSAVDQADGEGAVTPTEPARNTQNNQAVQKPATKTPEPPATVSREPVAKAKVEPASGLHWLEVARDVGIEDSELDVIIAKGGPATPKGMALWMAMAGQPFPEGTILEGLELPAKGLATGPATLSFADWRVSAAAQSFDADDLATIETMGGPFSAKGAKMWAALFEGAEVPAEIERPAGQAAALAPAATPAPKPKMSWQTFARTLDGSEDDLQAVENAGGPATAKGKKLWDVLFTVEIPLDTVDINPATDAPVATPAAPAEAPKPRGRAAKKTAPPAETKPAVVETPAAPAETKPAATPVAAPAGEPVVADGQTDLASAFAEFE